MLIAARCNTKTMVFDTVQSLFLRLTGWDWFYIFTFIVLFTSFVERTLGIEFVGLRALRIIRRVFLWFLDWLLFPIKPQITKIREFAKGSSELEKKFLEVFNRDATQREMLEKIQSEQKTTLELILREIETIKHEVTFNSGTSLKDAVKDLQDNRREQTALLENLLLAQELAALRLEISDEQHERLTFHLTFELELDFICDAFLKNFGFAERDLIGKNWESMISQKSFDVVFAKWKRAAENKSRYSNEQYILDADGKEHFCLVRGYPLANGFFGLITPLEADGTPVLYERRRIKPPGR